MALSTTYLKAVSAYVVAIILIALVSPHTFLLAPYKIPANTIYITGASPGIVPTRFVLAPTDVTLNAQYRPRQTTTRRFHTKFKETWPVDGPRMVYIPSSGYETRLFINGTLTPMAKPMPLFTPGLGESWIRHDVPRWALVPNTNRFDIHFQADRQRAGLRAVYFGPTDKVQAVAKQQAIWMHGLPITGLVGSGFVVLLTLLGLAYGQRKQLYLLIGCLGTVCGFQAGMTFLGTRAPFSHMDLPLRFALPVSMLILLGMIWFSDRKPWERLRDYRGAFYALAVTGPLAGLAVMLGPLMIPGPLILATLSIVGALPLLWVMAGHMLTRDLKNRATKLAALTAKVSAQAEELDEQGQVIAREMRNRAILEERARFTRDIHDGIGGQLLSLLLRVRTGKLQTDQIASEIQTGLNDLRLVVDSMDHTGDGLLPALTTFRARAASQMSAANVNLIWTQADDISYKFTQARSTLHLYRFMQEAMTNVIRHSKAKTIHVTIYQDSESSPLHIQIMDDGDGLDGDPEQSPGKGLKNMRARADSLGAELTFTEGLGKTGLGIKLIIPVQSSA